MKFWKCVLYFAVSGVVSFLAGRLLPKSWFKAEHRPWRCRSWEKGGSCYERLNIRRWQNKLPDMSRILPFMMPPKKLCGDIQLRLPRMLQETCVAEFIHGLLCLTGLYCLRLWPGLGGFVMYLLYVLVFNVPYILIQRYNRPRLLRLQSRLQTRAESSPCLEI